MRGEILVVDDDVNMRKLIKDFLEYFGYDVICAGNARDALSLLDEEGVDIVITDYDMPDMNGLELTRLIRRIKPALPVIGISASCHGKRFIDAGANQFIAKPLGLKQLRIAVQSHLKASNGSEPLDNNPPFPLES